MLCFFFFFFQMHENKYLHLPVVDVDASTVVGVVNVMEILQATAGDKGSARYYYTPMLCCGTDPCNRFLHLTGLLSKRHALLLHRTTPLAPPSQSSVG